MSLKHTVWRLLHWQNSELIFSFVTHQPHVFLSISPSPPPFLCMSPPQNGCSSQNRTHIPSGIRSNAPRNVALAVQELESGHNSAHVLPNVLEEHECVEVAFQNIVERIPAIPQIFGLCLSFLGFNNCSCRNIIKQMKLKTKQKIQTRQTKHTMKPMNIDKKCKGPSWATDVYLILGG